MDKCQLCQAKNPQLLYKLKTSNIFRCTNCNFAYSDYKMNSKQVLNLYNESYFKTWGIQEDEGYKIVRKMKMATFNQYLDLIDQFSENKKSTRRKILDIGCATGFLLESAKAKGYICYGVEVSDYACRLAKKTFGNNIFCGSLKDVRFPSNFFDVVTMSDVLEHFTNPLEELKEVCRILKKKAILLIVTPNLASLSAKVMKKYWTNFKEEHLFYFDVENMRSALKQNGIMTLYVAGAKKTLNLAYMIDQFKIYKIPLISQIFAGFAILPKSIRTFNFQLPSGDMFVIGKKI